MEQKTEINGIFRSDTGALINKDNKSLLHYKMKKEEVKKITKLENDFQKLSFEVEKIKKMLENFQENKT
jgi:hydroxymethylpyrimidine pyrophosphatase-like HAD family hydrolase